MKLACTAYRRTAKIAAMPIRRLPERAQHERAQLYAVLDAMWVATLSVAVGEVAQSVPILYGRDGDSIVLHGSTGAGTLRLLAAGRPATLCVSTIDGFVYAESLFDSSANYRSAVVTGPVEVLSGAAADAALLALSERIMPGRATEVRPSTRKELAATVVLRLPILEGSYTVKVRDGGTGETPTTDDTWSGVLPVHTVFGTPVPEVDGIPLPASIHARLATGR